MKIEIVKFVARTQKESWGLNHIIVLLSAAVSLLHQWKNCFAIWQIKGYHCWLYQIFYGLFDNSWNMFGSHIYCQHVVLFCLCLYENQATTNPYNWQGIMWLYTMITISKYIRNISWFIWESENSEYTGHYVLM